MKLCIIGVCSAVTRNPLPMQGNDDNTGLGVTLDNRPPLLVWLNNLNVMDRRTPAAILIFKRFLWFPHKMRPDWLLSRRGSVFPFCSIVLPLAAVARTPLLPFRWVSFWPATRRRQTNWLKKKKKRDNCDHPSRRSACLQPVVTTHHHNAGGIQTVSRKHKAVPQRP